MLLEDVRLLCLPEQDVGGFSLWNVLRHCMERGFLKAGMGFCQELCMVSHSEWK